jgi:hypothetical protein
MPDVGATNHDACPKLSATHWDADLLLLDHEYRKNRRRTEISRRRVLQTKSKECEYRVCFLVAFLSTPAPLYISLTLGLRGTDITSPLWAGYPNAPHSGPLALPGLSGVFSLISWSGRWVRGSAIPPSLGTGMTPGRS